MIKETAYQTTACKGFMLGKLEDALEKARLSHYIDYEQDGYDHIFAIRRSAYLQEAIPTFVYPVVVGEAGERRVYFDARPYMRPASDGGQYIGNQNGYDSAKMLAVLQKLWLTEPVKYLRNISKLPLAAFCSWVGDNIAKRVALDPNDQLSVTVLAGVLYLNSFLPNEDRTEHEKMDMVSLIAKATGAKSSAVYDIVHDRSRIDNVDEFCDTCQDYTKSTRLRDLNATTLYAIVGSTWYGANKSEMVAVALEFPPVWMTMVFQALNDRGFHHSLIAKMLNDRSSFKKEGQTYVIALSDFIVGFRNPDFARTGTGEVAGGGVPGARY